MNNPDAALPMIEETTSTNDFSSHLERIWAEIKEISRQVEQETRRSGKIARLTLEIRRLRRSIVEQTSGLGMAVYKAQQTGTNPSVSAIPGTDELVATIGRLHDQVKDKQQQIERLRQSTAASVDVVDTEAEADKDTADND